MDKTPLDIAWVVISAGFVFLMQAGFMCLESGLTRSKNNINVAIKNIMDFGISVLLFWAFGFALMFGATEGGLFGLSHFFVPVTENAGPWLATFFLFQAMFVGTATTIVSGAVAERMRFRSYLIFAAILSGLIYPLFGHWAWAGALDGEYVGWLAKLGFRDFAGSSVVHSTGGWVALAVVLVIGPRTGRFPADGPPAKIPASNLPLAILGTLILWFGWFGFNGGSTFAMNGQVPRIIANTMLSGVAGLMTAMAVGGKLRGRAEVHLAMNGALAGLVAITANCNVVSSTSAVVIGAVGALVMLFAEWLLERNRIDDVVGAVPVHAAAGVWGTLAVAIFGKTEALNTGLSWEAQIGVQLLGIVVCFAWSFGAAYLALQLISPYLPLRVSPDDERIGLNVAEHGAATELQDLFTVMDQQTKTGDLSSRAPVEPFTEVGQIADRYNRVLDRLQHARDESEKIVGRASDAIIAFSQQVDGNAHTVAQGVEKLRVNIQQISESATEVADVADQAVDVANATHVTVDQLGKSSEEIGKITNVIKSIAKQTNTLALNATIEAARAGESGRGFAVVANAVMALSTKTAKATEDIGSKIAAIQKETQGAVAAIDRIGEIIVKIHDYQKLVGQKSVSTTEISHSVAEAARGSVETAREISAAARTARETSAHQLESAASSETSNGIAGLEQLVERFQVSP